MEPSYTGKKGRGNVGCTGELCCAVGSEYVGVSVLCCSLVHRISFSTRPVSAGEVYLLCVGVSVAVNRKFPHRIIQTTNLRYRAQICIKQLHRLLTGSFMAPSNGCRRSFLALLLDQ